MYLEMGDFSGAAAALRQDPPRRMDKDNLHVWGINYPAAFRHEISRLSAANGLDPSLVFALVRAESRFSPRATSPVGARGLMQLMPATARAIDKVAADPDRLYQPELNLRLGTRHLKDLIDRYDGNLVPVIASYNAGAGNVDRWLKAFGGMDQSEFIENIPFPETRDYVKKVLAGREIYRRLYLPATTVATREN
jgi:soluble lytic murein transglycosylase